MNQLSILIIESIIITVLYLMIPFLENIIDLLSILFVWFGKNLIKSVINFYVIILIICWIILLSMTFIDLNKSLHSNGYNLNELDLNNMFNINIDKISNIFKNKK